MNFQEQLKYDKLQRLQEHLQIKPAQRYSAVSKTEGIVQGAVSAIIEPKLQLHEIRPESKEKSSRYVELDTENYGAPPENSDITTYKHGIQSPNISPDEPQAWEDSEGNWFYNFAGAVKLGKKLGRMLPEIDELLTVINANSYNFHQGKGYRHFDITGFCELDRSYFWSVSSNYYGQVRICAYVEHKDSSIHRNPIDHHHGLSVRFIVDKK